MQRSASLPVTRTGVIERESHRRAAPSRLFGAAALAAIYGAAVYASRGLFGAPPDDPYGAAYRLLGVANVVLLPALMLLAVAGIRRLWRDGTPNPRLCRLIMAPLWVSFIASLLTVPLWMGMANMDRQGAGPTASGYSATFLLAPWGLLFAYGLALFVACAMYDFTFPVVPEANAVDIRS